MRMAVTIKKVEAVQVEIDRLQKAMDKLKAKASSSNSLWCHPKESGSVKRASMDLSRSLSALRKPDF